MTQELNLKLGAVLGGNAKSTFTSLRNGIRDVAVEMQKLAKEQIKLGKTDIGNSLNIMAKRLHTAGAATKETTKEFKKGTVEGKKFGAVIQQLSRSFQTYGRYMVASGSLRAMTGGWQAGTVAIKEHDQALHDLKAIMNATDTEVSIMNDTILEVAAKTKFSIGETAKAMKLLGQSGFTASEGINALGPVAELATGTLSSLDSTVQLISTAIRVFQLDASEAGRVTDIFGNAVNRSKLTIDKLNTAFNYIGPIANAAGLSIEEVSASMMLLANAGLRASTIGTGMRRMLTLLLKPTTAFKEAVYAAGFTMDDMNPKMNKFSTIVANLGGVVTDAEDAVKMFGIRGASVIASFSSQGQAEFDRLAQIILRTGAASKMAAEQMKGLGNAIKNMKDKFGVLAQAIGAGGFTATWKLLVDTIRATEDVLITLARTGIGQLVIQIAGAVTGVTLLIASFILLRKAFTSAVVVGFTAQVVELTARILTLNFSMKGLASVNLVTAFGNLGGAFKSLKTRIVSTVAAFTSFVAINPILSTALIAIGAVVAASTVGWVRNTKALKDSIVENEVLAGSLEIVKSSIARYVKVLDNSGTSEKALLIVKKQVLKTFDSFGSSIEGYSEKQEALNKELQQAGLTETQLLGIYAKKGKLLKDYVVGNVKKLTSEEMALKEAAGQAAEVLRDETSSLEAQNEAIKILAGVIDTQLIKAYDAQATAAITLWAQTQTLADAWERLKKIISFPIVFPYQAIVTGLDFIRQRLLGMPSIAEEAKYSFLGISHSFTELKERAAEGVPKAVEALGLLEQFAQKTVESLLANVDVLELSNEEIGTMVAGLQETDEVKLAAIQEEIEKVKLRTIEANKTFRKAFGKDLTAEAQEALKGILFILNESKNTTKDLTALFLELGASNFEGLTANFEALEASLRNGKVDSATLKETFAQMFDKLPADKWQAFSNQIRNGMKSIGSESQVIAIATEAMLAASFSKLGVEMEKVPAKFQAMNVAFMTLTLSGKASSAQIAEAFKKLGSEVNSAGSFDVLLSTFRDLQSTGVITGVELERSFKVVEEAFKQAFKEPLKEVANAREAVKVAATELSEVYGEALAKIESDFSATFEGIVANFNKVEQTIQNSDLSLDAKAKKMTQAYKQFATDSSAAIKDFETKSLTYIDHLYTTIKEDAKTNGVDIKEIEKKTLEDKKAVYAKTVTSHKQLMDKLVQHEESRKEKVKQIENEIADTRRTHAEKMRDLQRGGMSSVEAYQDTKNELAEVTRKLSQAVYKSDEWNALVARGESLAGDLNTEVSETANLMGQSVKGAGSLAAAEMVHVSAAEGRKNAMAGYNKLQRITVQKQQEALKIAQKEVQVAENLTTEQGKALKAAEDGASNLAGSINQSLVDATDSFGTEVDKLANTLKDNKLVIDAENLLDEVKAEIASFSGDFEKDNKLQMTVEPKVEEFQDKIKELLDSDQYPALELLIDDVKAKETLAGVQAEFDELVSGFSDKAVEFTITGDSTDIDEIKAKVDDLAATDDIHVVVKAKGEEIDDLVEKIGKVEDKEVEAKAVVAASSMSAVSKLYEAIKKIKSKTVTITVKYKTVGKPPAQNRAEGGFIELADGGDPYHQFRRLHSPEIRSGSGHKDDVPAMLMKGEFVLRKSAVAKYGKRFLYQLNQGVINNVPKFKEGGVVNNISNIAHGAVTNISDRVNQGVRIAQLAMNPSAPFKHNGVTLNINAPSLYQDLNRKASNIKTEHGKKRTLALTKLFKDVVPQLQTGGSTDVLSNFKEEKRLITQMYMSDIKHAQDSGEDEMAHLLEMERIQIEELAAQLIITLEQIRLDYETELLKVSDELEEKIIGFTGDKTDAKLAQRKSLAELNFERSGIEIDYKREIRELEQKIGPRWSKDDPGRIRINQQMALSKQDYERDMDALDLKLRYINSDAKQVIDRSDIQIGRTEARFEADQKLNERKQDNEILSAESTHRTESQKTAAKADYDIGKVDRGANHEVNKLQIELKMELLELRKKYDALLLEDTQGSGVQEFQQSEGVRVTHWLNKGGPVGYPSGKKRNKDDVAAMLTPGEYVIQEEAVQHYGENFMDSLNNKEADSSFNTFPSNFSPTVLDDVMYHVNAPSFHKNLSGKTFTTPVGLSAAKEMTEIFANAVPHLHHGGGLGTVEEQLWHALENARLEYEALIAEARASGESELAYILEREALELEMLARELEFTLEELLRERDQLLAELDFDFQQAMEDLAREYLARMEELQNELDILNNPGPGDPPPSDRDWRIAQRERSDFEDRYDWVRLYPHELQQGVDDGMLERYTIPGQSGVYYRHTPLYDDTFDDLQQTERNARDDYYEARARWIANRNNQNTYREREIERIQREMLRTEENYEFDQEALAARYGYNQRKADRKFTFESYKANKVHEFDARKVSFEADRDGREREREMYHEIKMLEIELAKTLFDIHKEYGSAPGDFGVRHWLNKGGHVGMFPEAVRGKDSVAAMLTPGEYVVKESVVSTLGKSFFDKLNNFQLPDLSRSIKVEKFAEGGFVPGGNGIDTTQKSTQSDTFLGTINLQVGKNTYPVQTNLNLAKQLISDFKRMGLSIA